MRFVGFIALAMAPAIAAAQPTDKPAAAAGDESKPVTREAINAKLDADYADLDANSDGKVDAAEINARLVKSAEADLETIRKKRDDTFAKLDADGNGSISKAEFEAKAPLPRIKEPDAKPFLDQFDADKDGGITKQEFRAPTLANFERLDADKDGMVSPDEVKKGSATAVDATPAAPAPKPTPVKKPAVKETPPIGR